VGDVQTVSLKPVPARSVWLAAALFAAIGLLLQWWRLQVLTASMDQGIFLQVLWNGLRGHAFESTLSSQLSTNVVHSGELPALGYHRLGQHFTPALALWIPLVGLIGKWALPVVQVGLMTAAGLVLHRLALTRLEPPLASRIAIAFFAANAVIGPTWGNFTDLCQLPLCIFLLLLALEKRIPWLIAISALLIPLIREDTGVLLVGIALWLLVRRREHWRLATVLALYGGGWVLLVTNGLMPLFSDDNTRRFMVENFGQYIQGQDQASSLDVLGQVLRKPLLLLQELVSPPRQTITYLLGQGLPLLFIPLISLDSWLLMGLPLLGLLLAQGNNNPLSINIRYTLLVVPGLFAGAICWWQQHAQLFTRARIRSIWSGCVMLSLIFALTSNPNRSLSWLVPDSIHPWVYSTPWRQWQHGSNARSLLRTIPADASVAASTPLIPHLANREVLVRYPEVRQYLNRGRQAQPVDWIAMDLDWVSRYAPAFRRDRAALRRSIKDLRDAQGQGYAIQDLRDGVVLLKRGGTVDAAAQQRLDQLLRTLEGHPARPS
jgi:uncharacterized membrane protein